MLSYFDHRIGLSKGDWLPTVFQSPLGKQSIALSFDDGPSPHTTERIVELLQFFDAQATFFLCGKRVEQYPHLVKKIVEFGFGVYAHGYSHTRLDLLAPEEAIAELAATEALLAQFRPTPSPYLVRLPYGSGHRSTQMHRLLKRWRPDCQIAHWGYNPEDFALANNCKTFDDLSRNCDKAVTTAFSRSSFYGSVVLLHEDPFEIDDPLSPHIAPILLERILQAARSRAINVTQVNPKPHSFISQYVRLGFME